MALTGGEPLVARGVFEVAQRLRAAEVNAQRLRAAGVKLPVNTSGRVMNRALAERLADHFDEAIVSLDGATSEVHDRIRGREGSFERVLAALTLLDEVAAERSTADRGRPCFGVDGVVIRSDFGQLEDIVGDITHRFPRLTTLGFNTDVPEGLASHSIRR
ncbi:radical SAM protein [Streptomyces sp. AN091965]|nr:radical SAM protein [Streptomyces sp. AN091965]MCI3928350.1 radical SAM protein [Streptomyces sp. AN091965]